MIIVGLAGLALNDNAGVFLELVTRGQGIETRGGIIKGRGFDSMAICMQSSHGVSFQARTGEVAVKVPAQGDVSMAVLVAGVGHGDGDVLPKTVVGIG